MSKYRIIWEMVNPIGPGAKYYDNFRGKPICMPGDVEEKDWSEVINNTDDPWDQYDTLKAWAKSGEHLIRDVQLYEISETIKEITREFPR